MLGSEEALLMLLLNVWAAYGDQPTRMCTGQAKCSLGVKTALNPHLPPFEKRNPERLFYTFLIHDIYRSCKYPPELGKE